MRRLLGCLCVLAAGAAGWSVDRRRRRQEQETLHALVSALSEMERQIRIARTPLPRLTEQLGRRGGQAGAFFSAAAAAMRQGEAPAAVWAEAARQLSLAGHERQALIDLLPALQGDEGGACRGLALARQQIAEGLAQRRRCRGEEERRAAALWFSAAALLAILWI